MCATDARNDSYGLQGLEYLRGPEDRAIEIPILDGYVVAVDAAAGIIEVAHSADFDSE